MPTSQRLQVNYHDAAPLDWPDGNEHRRQLAAKINEMLGGKLNNTGTITLTANQATSTLSDARIGGGSVILFTPTTANAAAEVGAGGMYVSAKADGSATITHANNAQADRTFDYVIMG